MSWLERPFHSQGKENGTERPDREKVYTFYYNICIYTKGFWFNAFLTISILWSDFPLSYQVCVLIGCSIILMCKILLPLSIQFKLDAWATIIKSSTTVQRLTTGSMKSFTINILYK